jgi:hypothetical protein
MEDVSIVRPKADEDGRRSEQPILTVKVVLEKMAGATTPEIADKFRAFLTEAETLGLDAEGVNASVSLAWYDPNTGRRFSFASVYWDGGTVRFNFVLHYFRAAGLDEEIGWRYVRAVASLANGAVVREHKSAGKAMPRVFVGDNEITLADLLPRAGDWLKALETVIAETESTAAKAAPAMSPP